MNKAIVAKTDNGNLNYLKYAKKQVLDEETYTEVCCYHI